MHLVCYYVIVIPEPPKLSPSIDISSIYIYNQSLNSLITSNETPLVPSDYSLIDDANPYPVRICINIYI